MKMLLKGLSSPTYSTEDNNGAKYEENQVAKTLLPARLCTAHAYWYTPPPGPRFFKVQGYTFGKTQGTVTAFSGQTSHFYFRAGTKISVMRNPLAKTFLAKYKLLDPSDSRFFAFLQNMFE